MGLGKVRRTERGFEIISFKDCYENDCSLQQSSLADYDTPGTSAVWLGIGLNRMHLDLEQVKGLVIVLSRWVKYGSFDKENSLPEFVDEDWKVFERELKNL